jgi:hypothetical protein
MQTYIELAAHTMDGEVIGTGKLSADQATALLNALGGMFGSHDPELRDAAFSVWQMLDDARKSHQLRAYK